jgi:hypothetical protein
MHGPQRVYPREDHQVEGIADCDNCFLFSAASACDAAVLMAQTHPEHVPSLAYPREGLSVSVDGQ